MKIAVCSTSVPFIGGGAKNIFDWLCLTLEKWGHTVERVYLPQVDSPDTLFNQMAAFRWIDLSCADRIICLRPQSHLIPHPQKIVWFIHHIRVFYDLWDTQYRTFPDSAENRGFREALQSVDTRALLEAKNIFTNSKVVSDRLQTYNKIQSEVLYPPVFESERFCCEGYNDEIVYISRLEHHKRQHLLIEAMQYVSRPVTLRICGDARSTDYTQHLRDLVTDFSLTDKVIIEEGWISEERKISLLSQCLATAYLPVDEDSYGYPSLEASHSSKAILTTSDSGGVMELIDDEYNGYIAEPNPKSIAEQIDRFYTDRNTTEKMGKNAQAKLGELNISWSHVVESLLA